MIATVTVTASTNIYVIVRTMSADSGMTGSGWPSWLDAVEPPLPPAHLFAHLFDPPKAFPLNPFGFGAPGEMTPKLPAALQHHLRYDPHNRWLSRVARRRL